MDEELLKSIRNVSTGLLKAKQELARYNKEDYLNLTEERGGLDNC